jgi:hypothetical protein
MMLEDKLQDVLKVYQLSTQKKPLRKIKNLQALSL